MKEYYFGPPDDGESKNPWEEEEEYQQLAGVIHNPGTVMVREMDILEKKFPRMIFFDVDDPRESADVDYYIVIAKLGGSKNFIITKIGPDKRIEGSFNFILP